MAGKNRVLIVGGDSKLAEQLRRGALSENCEVVCTTRRSRFPGSCRSIELDLSSQVSIDTVNLEGFSHAILLAGVTSIQECERYPEQTRRVNVDGLGHLVERLFDAGVRVTTVSTSQVFSRFTKAPAPDAPREPTCVYGIQKALLEDITLSGELGQVVRLTKVVTDRFTLIDDWLERLALGAEVEAFSNVAISPILLKGFANELWRLIFRSPQVRVAHFSADRECSYADLITELATDLRLPGRVRSVQTTKGPISGIIVGPHASLGTGGDCGFLLPFEDVRAHLASTFSARIASRA